jgi:hypothetical protein
MMTYTPFAVTWFLHGLKESPWSFLSLLAFFFFIHQFTTVGFLFCYFLVVYRCMFCMNSDGYKLFHQMCSYRIAAAAAATLPCVVVAKHIFVAA